MSPARACADCGRIVTSGNRCPEHAVANQAQRNATKAQAFARRGISSWDWRRLRARILKRDSFRCVAVIDGTRCSETEHLEVHHIDGNGANNVEPNLATLCRAHHGYFTRMLNARAA